MNNRGNRMAIFHLTGPVGPGAASLTRVEQAAKGTKKDGEVAPAVPLDRTGRGTYQFTMVAKVRPLRWMSFPALPDAPIVAAVAGPMFPLLRLTSPWCFCTY
jgi:hypothetical protein